MKYWQLDPYAGFGGDFHSFDGVMRAQNIESPSDYVATIESPISPHELPASQSRRGRFFVGLRLSRGGQPREEEWCKFERPIRRFMDEGLLARGDRGSGSRSRRAIFE